MFLNKHKHINQIIKCFFSNEFLIILHAYFRLYAAYLDTYIGLFYMICDLNIINAKPICLLIMLV